MSPRPFGEPGDRGQARSAPEPVESTNYQMHPAKGPPSWMLPAWSVSKVFPLQVFSPQPSLSSDMSTPPLVSDVFRLTTLPAPTLLHRDADRGAGVHRLSSAVLPGERMPMPLTLRVSALARIVLPVPL